MADKGWIKTYRKIQECWIWLDKEPFDKRSAWIDLLLTANHADKKILFNGELITVKRGQILTSVRKLAIRWGWSNDKILRFLRLLESDEMLKKDSDKYRTLITIENYEVYQENTNTERTETSTPTSTPVSHKQECKECKEINNNISCAFSDENHNTLNEFFESIWKLYPIKKGKGQISKAKKQTLQRIGYEQIKRCVDRFVEDMESTKRDKKYWMHGSTFFNSGYVDYLDENYGKGDSEDEYYGVKLW